MPLLSEGTAAPRAYFLERLERQEPVHQESLDTVLMMLERREERMVERIMENAVSSGPYIAHADDTQTLHLAPPEQIDIDIEPVSSSSQSSASSISSIAIVSSSSIPSSSSARVIELRSSASSVSSIAPVPSSSSVAPVISSAPASDFPEMGNAIFPVSKVPNWGAMTKASQWERSYKQMNDEDFVSIPSYNLSVLTTPMDSLVATRNDPETIKTLTAKLFYSTRHFGAYDLDATEFTAIHPGIDLKLPEGTPIGTVAGGRVRSIEKDDSGLGLHVIIEHRSIDGTAFYSIYGHLGASSVSVGQDVTAGQMIGTVGVSGNTTGAHLHLQIDRGLPNEAAHKEYWPSAMPSRSEAEQHTINPITFIKTY